MFNGLPQFFADKEQNEELYVQKLIYESITFLKYLQMNQNPEGLFSSYISDSVEVADPEYTGNNVDYNEIRFNEGKVINGKITPKGFMYKANTRLEQEGKLDNTLMSFYNNAVMKIADFYESQYATSVFAGGRASTIQLSAWDTAENIINNEIALDDEMRYDANDNATGFRPTTAIVSRKDRLKIEQGLRKENYNDNNFTYVSSNKVPNGKMVLFQEGNAGAVIEKFTDPNYSVIQQMADDGIRTAEGEVIPQAFLNLSTVTPNRPQTRYYYIWAESAMNIFNSNGFLVVNTE